MAHASARGRAAPGAREPFDQAWPHAIRTIPSDRTGVPLREVLAQTREAWARAYGGEPPAVGERACLTLVQLLGEFEPPGEAASEARRGVLVA